MSSNLCLVNKADSRMYVPPHPLTTVHSYRAVTTLVEVTSET